MNQNVYAMLPVNKAAAIVTSQKGCSEVDSCTQQRECLALRISQLDRELSGLPKNHKIRKDLGQEKFLLQERIRRLNTKIKYTTAVGLSLDSYIIKAAMSNSSAPTWRKIMAQAREDKSAADKFYQNRLSN